MTELPLNTSWNIIDTGNNPGEWNMDHDRALAAALQRGEAVPTLRLFGWKPWVVSLGYHQTESDIDPDRCAEFGIDIVRRPTGGRAILHANELTYSVVMYAEGKGITETYSAISKALVEGLSQIVPSVSYETSQPNFAAFYREQESIPCFSASARYEVQIRGKKLVGSAQRRFVAPGLPEVVLQHGSILLGTEHRLLVELLRLRTPEIKQKIAADIDHKTIDLSSAAGRTISYDEAASTVRYGFERTIIRQNEQKTGIPS